MEDFLITVSTPTTASMQRVRPVTGNIPASSDCQSQNSKVRLGLCGRIIGRRPLSLATAVESLRFPQPQPSKSPKH